MGRVHGPTIARRPCDDVASPLRNPAPNYHPGVADPRQLEPFVGDWRLEASLAPGVAGRASFEWALDETFLVQRASIPVEGAPESLSIMALDHDGQAFTMHYFDSRGIVRLYRMTIDDGGWTLLRTEADFSPLPFHQRYVGRFSDDGRRIDGRWEKSDSGTDWQLDFELNYIRA
jgi:hypothetical protein